VVGNQIVNWVLKTQIMAKKMVESQIGPFQTSKSQELCNDIRKFSIQ
jgi:hypothetical protein